MQRKNSIKISSSLMPLGLMVLMLSNGHVCDHQTFQFFPFKRRFSLLTYDYNFFAEKFLEVNQMSMVTKANDSSWANHKTSDILYNWKTSKMAKIFVSICFSDFVRQLDCRAPILLFATLIATLTKVLTPIKSSDLIRAQLISAFCSFASKA